MHTDSCGHTSGQECHATESRKETKMCVEIQREWNMKCVIKPVITGATGIATRVLKKHWEAISGKHSIDSLQKTAIQ